MLIASRNSFAVKPKRKWQNPYITNGLVAMWDGQWNAGSGRHSVNAVMWKNLVSNSPDFAFGSNIGLEWGTDFLQLFNGEKSKITVSSILLLPSVENHVEIVAKATWKYSDSYANIQSPIEWTGGTVPVFRHKENSSSKGPGISIFSSYPTKYYAYNGIPTYDGSMTASYSVRGPCTTSGTLLYNAVGYSIPSNYNTSTSRTNGELLLNRSPRADVELYCVRFYNRALSAEEIAANYAVDKIRFNLA